jgi:hypothetical protein
MVALGVLRLRRQGRLETAPPMLTLKAKTCQVPSRPHLNPDGTERRIWSFKSHRAYAFGVQSQPKIGTCFGR